MWVLLLAIWAPLNPNPARTYSWLQNSQKYVQKKLTPYLTWDTFMAHFWPLLCMTSSVHLWVQPLVNRIPNDASSTNTHGPICHWLMMRFPIQRGKSNISTLHIQWHHFMLGVSALHYSTGTWEGFWMLVSACTLCLTTHYSCPSISGAYQRFWGCPEVSGVNLELSIVQHVSIEVTNKARVL